MMRKAVLVVFILLALRLLPRAFRREAQVLQLITILTRFLWVAVSPTANTSKAYATELRTSALETRTGNLEQGIIPNTSIGTVNIVTVSNNASNAVTTANNAFPKTGGTISGSVTVNGNHTVSGTVSAGTIASSGNASVSDSLNVQGYSGMDWSTLNNVAAQGAPTKAGTFGESCGSDPTPTSGTISGAPTAGNYNALAANVNELLGYVNAVASVVNDFIDYTNELASVANSTIDQVSNAGILT